MMNTLYKNKSFCFRGSFRTIIETLPWQDGNALLRAFIQYGIMGDYPHNPNIDAPMILIANSINATNQRMAANIANGKRGGRPRKASYKDICGYYCEYTDIPIEKVAQSFGVSVRTVQRAICKIPLLYEKHLINHNEKAQLIRDQMLKRHPYSQKYK